MLQQAETEQIIASEYLTDEARYYVKERARMWVRAYQDEKYRAVVYKACKDGIQEMPGYLFYFRYFGSIFEPRNPPGFQKLPFIPYEYQIEELAYIHHCIQAGSGINGDRSLTLYKKSRDMGLTWIVTAYFLWDFLFNQGVYHVGARTDDDVDKKGDRASVMGKMRHLLYETPPFFRPADLVDNDKLLSYGNGEAAITGQTSSANFGRSKRCKAAALDEFQTWEYDRTSLRSISLTTNCIFLIGTPFGYGNHYAEICHHKKDAPKAEIRTVHWTAHPLKIRGLEIVDGKPTSPWYRNQTKIFTSDVVAGEIDLSFENSQKGLVFNDDYGVGHQRKGLRPIPGLPIYRTWDPGGTWSAVYWLQRTRENRLLVLRERIFEDKNLHEIAEEVKAVSNDLDTRYAPVIGDSVDYFTFLDVGDPSGSTISKANQENSEYETLANMHGIHVDYLFMAALNTTLRVKARINAIRNAMKRHISSNSPEKDGPAFLMDPEECPTLDSAFKGGYRRKTDTNGNIMDAIDDSKRPYTDAVDSLGYGAVYLLGIPPEIKALQPRKSEEQIEDEQHESQAKRKRSRC